jgi:plasmid stabilization system protein ParE
MARYVLTDAARQDIRSIVDYIRRENPEAAKRVRTKLRLAMERLVKLPGIGHFRRDLTDRPVKFWGVYSYLIVYDPDSKPLTVVRVLHGSQDLPRLLKP